MGNIPHRGVLDCLMRLPKLLPGLVPLVLLISQVGGCGARGASVEVPQERIWCYERDPNPHRICIDVFLDSSVYPDEAIVCVDHPYKCASLGDLRDWLERYMLRLLVQYPVQ